MDSILKMNSDVVYRELTMKLKNKLNLSDNQRKILNLPAITRNSLHNNGYHKEKDFDATIGSKTYEFQKDKQVNFAGWDNFYIMFDELLNIIEIILKSSDVKQLQKIPHTSMTYRGTP